MAPVAERVPPFTTVQYYFYRWRDDGTWLRINHELVMLAREREGRGQPIGEDHRGGRTTWLRCGQEDQGAQTAPAADTLGHLVAALVHPADVQDRDGAPKLLGVIRGAFPWLRHVFADAAYAGSKLEQSLAKLGQWTLEIVRRSDAVQGFELLPRRRVVERTIAWLNRNRRLAKDFEATIESAHAWLMIASVKMLLRRLARS